MQFKYLKYDLYRYFYPDDNISKITLLKKIMLIIFTQAIWAITVYRFRRWVIYECQNSIARIILKLVGAIFNLFIEITTGIHIGTEIYIGPGLYIGHFGCIFLGGNTKIGKFCNISQENTIGYAGRADSRGLPVIGDFVYLAPGAKIIGKIRIGNNVAIGANAVVTHDIPDNAVAVGVPAKVISFNSSRDFIKINRIKNEKILK